MFVFGFLVSFAGVCGVRVSEVSTGLQLLFILPSLPPFDPGSLGSRLVGLTIGMMPLIVTDRLLLPDPGPPRFAERLADAADKGPRARRGDRRRLRAGWRGPVGGPELDRLVEPRRRRRRSALRLAEVPLAERPSRPDPAGPRPHRRRGGRCGRPRLPPLGAAHRGRRRYPRPSRPCRSGDRVHARRCAGGVARGRDPAVDRRADGGARRRTGPVARGSGRGPRLGGGAVGPLRRRRDHPGRRHPGGGRDASRGARSSGRRTGARCPRRTPGRTTGSGMRMSRRSRSYGTGSAGTSRCARSSYRTPCASRPVSRWPGSSPASSACRTACGSCSRRSPSPAPRFAPPGAR